MERVDFCALPHHRPNLWNGAACRPALLQVGEGRIRVTRDIGELLFDEPLTAVRVRVTALGTMKIRTPRGKFAFYGRGSAISPSSTTGQLEYVRRFWQSDPPYPQLMADLPLLLDRDPAMGEGVSLKPLTRMLVAGGARSG